jgi:RNA polymerase primary sigma factor
MDKGIKELLVLLMSSPLVEHEEAEAREWLDSDEGRKWLDSDEGKESIEALKEQISVILADLNAKEASVLKARFGLEGTPQLTQVEIIEKHDVTEERVRLYESHFASKIRHPARSTLLRDYLEGGEWTAELENELGFAQPREDDPNDDNPPIKRF